ncbi:retrovirus-related pol polyprotein from transposon TNT 1-94 [Tanacetum coccineum]
MANLSEDIQSAGSDTCPPILDRETLAEGAKGALHLGPERDRVVDNVKMLLEGSELTKDDRESQLYDEFEHFRQNKGDTIHEYYVRQNRGQGNYARGAVAAGNGGVQNRGGNTNPSQAKLIKYYNCNRIGHIARQCTHPKRPENSKYFKDKMLPMQDQENGVAPTVQTMFMANLSSADLIFDEASPSYDSDILFEVQDHDNYVDSVGEYHEVHEMQNDVQPNYVINTDAEYTSDKNIILYEQYVKDNNKVVNESLTAELARYKEQVKLYEKGQIKTTHAPATMHDSEDTLELAETTRMKMLEKSKSTIWVDSNIKIASLDYSKENYLATLTP